MNRTPGPRTNTAWATLFLAMAMVLPSAAQETPDPVPHLILRVIQNDLGELLGYEVYHEEKKATYVALVSPASAAQDRCRMGEDDRLEVTERPGMATYEGKDGRPCTLTSFAPDPSPNTPRGLPPTTGKPACPTCPSAP